MTLQALFNKIRPKLGDSVARKFTNQRIIEVINEGLEDLGKKANVKKKVIALPVLPYQKFVTIPDDRYLRLQRVRQNGSDVEKYTFAEMDRNFGKWENQTGDNIRAIIYDLQAPGTFTIFPLLKETSTTYNAINDNTTGTLLLDIPNVPADSIYGIITSVDAEDIVTPVNVYNEEELAGYEPIVSISDIFITLEFTYYAYPDLLDTAEEDMETIVDLDNSYINTLSYYVAGVLLLDDSRTENVQKAQMYLARYTLDLKKDIGRTSDSSQGVDYPEIPYRTGF